MATAVTPPWQTTLARLWRGIQRPTAFGALTGILAIEGLLALVIPQRPDTFTSPADFVVWVSNLPPFFRQGYQFFSGLGLFGIFHSLWFWLPAAALMLVSLIAAAELFPSTVQRLRPSAALLTAPIAHSLQTLAIRNVRLTAPQNPGKATATHPVMSILQKKLTAAGFQINHQDETTLLATRHLWGWMIPLLTLLAIIFILSGTVIQTIWGNSEQAVLAQNATVFVGQTMTVTAFTPRADADGTVRGGTLTLAADAPPLIVWDLARWQRLNGWWIAPPKLQPRAQITFEDGTTTENLTLIFDDIARPLIFSYTPRHQSLELRYIATDGHSGYQLRMRDAQNATVETAVRNGNGFSLPELGITGKVSIQDKFLLRAVRVPGAAPLAMGALLMALGVTLWFLDAPAIVRLTAVTKGRGSRIDASVETRGNRRAAEMLADTYFSEINAEGNADDATQS